MRVANLNWNFRHVLFKISVSKERDEMPELYWESTKTAVASGPPTHPSHQIWSWTPKMLNPNLLSINFTQEPFKLNHFVHFCILFPSAEMSVYSWNAQIIIHQTTVEKHINIILLWHEKRHQDELFLLWYFHKRLAHMSFFRNTFYVRSGSSPSPVLRCSKTK